MERFIIDCHVAASFFLHAAAPPDRDVFAAVAMRPSSTEIEGMAYVAYYLAGQRILSCTGYLPTVLKSFLNFKPRCFFDYGRMVAFDKVLRQVSVIDVVLFRYCVKSERLLKNGVAAVLFVRQDAEYGLGLPNPVADRWDFVLYKELRYRITAVAFEKQAIDQSNGLGLLLSITRTHFSPGFPL